MEKWRRKEFEKRKKEILKMWKKEKKWYIKQLKFIEKHQKTATSNLKYLSESDIHVSLLINMGFSALAIGNRVGHETEKITYRYAHLFPTVQNEMAEKLEIERMTKED